MSTENQQPQNPVREVSTKPSIMKRFPVDGVKSKGMFFLIVGSLLVVLAGVSTGWFLSGGGVLGTDGEGIVGEQKKVDIGDGVVELGEAGEKADEAEGTLAEGGLEGEGTYRLERDGGAARTVCLTSTVIDLSPFVGKKVKVWGETISPISCPWLMDVVKIKGVRVVKGKNGLFAAMPRTQAKDGNWYEAVSLINDKMKKKLQTTVLKAYKA